MPRHRRLFDVTGVPKGLKNPLLAFECLVVSRSERESLFHDLPPVDARRSRVSVAPAVRADGKMLAGILSTLRDECEQPFE